MVRQIWGHNNNYFGQHYFTEASLLHKFNSKSNTTTKHSEAKEASTTLVLAN
jgi:hypothetical protein